MASFVTERGPYPQPSFLPLCLQNQNCKKVPRNYINMIVWCSLRPLCRPCERLKIYSLFLFFITVVLIPLMFSYASIWIHKGNQTYKVHQSFGSQVLKQLSMNEKEQTRGMSCLDALNINLLVAKSSTMWCYNRDINPVLQPTIVF